MKTIDNLREIILKSSATTDEKIQIFEALIKYINRRLTDED